MFICTNQRKINIQGVLLRVEGYCISESISKYYKSLESGKNSYKGNQPKEIAGNYFRVRKTSARGRNNHHQSQK